MVGLVTFNKEFSFQTHKS